jgi:hypothetical protein
MLVPCLLLQQHASTTLADRHGVHCTCTGMCLTKIVGLAHNELIIVKTPTCTPTLRYLRPRGTAHTSNGRHLQKASRISYFMKLKQDASLRMQLPKQQRLRQLKASLCLVSLRSCKSLKSQSHASRRCAASRHCKGVQRKQNIFSKTLLPACSLLLSLGVTNMTLKLTLRRL